MLNVRVHVYDCTLASAEDALLSTSRRGGSLPTSPQDLYRPVITRACRVYH